MPTKEAQKICFERRLSFGAVNSRGFEDLSLITGGVEALGHGLFVDEKSISGLTKLLMGKTVPGYLTHNGLAQGDRLGQEIGLFSGFYRDGMKVKAQQFTFLNSFKKHDAATHDKLVELASEVPDQFGLSVVFEGSAVWVDNDGDETPADEMKPENCSADYPCIRFSAVESADFVKAPAANPDGLLAEKVDESANVFMATKTELDTHVAALAVKDAEIAALSASNKAALDKLTADHVAALASALTAKDEEHAAELAEIESQVSEIEKTSAEALAAKDVELAAAKVMDITKSGVAPAIAMAAHVAVASAVTLPAPGKFDSENWEIYSGLAEKSPAVAAEFKAKYLTRFTNSKYVA